MLRFLSAHRRSLFEALFARSQPGTAIDQSRDLRIDLFRGLALWMIFADHVPGNLVHCFTYQQLGCSSALDIFVFLSGISSSLAYGRILSRQGLLSAQLRALRRVGQIYIGYILVIVFSFSVVAFSHGIVAADPGFGVFIAAPARAFAAALYLYYTPGYIDILPLYMVLVLIAPMIIFGLRRRPGIILGISAAVWIAATLYPEVNVPHLLPTSVAGVNPFSWQILFCIGLWAGEHYYAGGRDLRPNPKLAMTCCVIIAVNLVVRVITIVPVAAALHLDHIWLLDIMRAARDSNNQDSVFRLTHFLAIAYIVAGYAIRPNSGLVRQPAMFPLIWCGQHSLSVFCLGILLSELVTVYFGWQHPGVVDQLTTNVACAALMIALGWFLNVRKRASRPELAGGVTR
jgi:hypothetical protein